MLENGWTIDEETGKKKVKRLSIEELRDLKERRRQDHAAALGITVPPIPQTPPTEISQAPRNPVRPGQVAAHPRFWRIDPETGLRTVRRLTLPELREYREIRRQERAHLLGITVRSVPLPPKPRG